MSKKNRPPKNVHKNAYEGRTGSLGRKQEKKQRGAYHPKATQNQGPSEDVEDYSVRPSYSSSRRTESRSNNSSSGLDFLALDKSISAGTLDSRVQERGCWLEYMGVSFKRGDNDGFIPSEIAELAPQLSTAARESKEHGKCQHVLVAYNKRKFYVLVDSIGYINYPTSFADGKIRNAIITDDPSKIIGFRKRDDWYK